jgi:hypothetical protein
MTYVGRLVLDVCLVGGSSHLPAALCELSLYLPSVLVMNVRYID